MGTKLIDQYSLLHFATGIIFCFFNISLLNSFIIHTIFEISENTKAGIHFIDNYLTFWPGGKKSSDSFINSVGDTIFFLLGWIIAYFIKN
jgi:hypothetical protein